MKIKDLDEIRRFGLEKVFESLCQKKQFSLTGLSLTQRVAFTIFFAKQFNPEDKIWNDWANRWLTGKDRTKGTAKEILKYCYERLGSVNHNPLNVLLPLLDQGAREGTLSYARDNPSVVIGGLMYLAAKAAFSTGDGSIKLISRN